MEEIYELIEDRIRATGYDGEEVDGFSIYDEISDEIDGKEEGSYIFMSKKTDDVYYEYKVDVYEEAFNLSYIDIHTVDRVYHVDFDAE